MALLIEVRLKSLEHPPVDGVTLRFDMPCPVRRRRVKHTSFAADCSGKGVNTDHLALEDLQNPGEDPPLFDCEYVELPGHSGSFRRAWLRTKKKPPTDSDTHTQQRQLAGDMPMRRHH
jgi:hypothetical protein